MSPAIFIFLSVASAALSFLGALGMIRYSNALGLTDLPNDRSLHTKSTPRGGGIGFACVVPVLTAVGLHVFQDGISVPERALLTASAALSLVGLADDRIGLPVAVRLVAQLIAAAAVTLAGAVIRDVTLPGIGVIPLAAFRVPITIVWLLGLTNIYNFMDGIDGIASVQAIVAAAAIGAAAASAGSGRVAFAMTILGAGVFGFLLLNWAPARVFMGDVGSTFLGFTLAGWAAVASQSVPLIIWIAALSPFLFDSSITLMRRLLNGERVYMAHRTHYYQRLAQQGWSHAQTTLLYGALAALSATIAGFSMTRGAGSLIWIALVPPMFIPLVLRSSALKQSTGSESL